MNRPFDDQALTPEQARLVIADHGRPSVFVRESFNNQWAAFASEDDEFLVMENLFAFFEAPSIGYYGEFAGVHAPVRFLPRSYGWATVRAPDGLCPLHDDPEALWIWRPSIYTYNVATDRFEGMGSQRELEWRYGLRQVQVEKVDVLDEVADYAMELAEQGLDWEEAEEILKAKYREVVAERAANPADWFSLPEANAKADRILREHLDWQQTIDLDAWSHFFVRGTINPLYRIEIGNGFAVVDPVTHEVTTQFCLHPEEWIPDGDIALAIKLAIDAGPVTEFELLEAANGSKLPVGRVVTAEDRHAARLEQRLGLY